jgi:hypothetical protein
LGISIKAKAQKIPTLVALEADKLAEELGADEKRIKKLQEELAEAKSALPNLKLCFGDGQNIFRVIRKLLDNIIVARFLKASHPDLYSEFEKIAATETL